MTNEPHLKSLKSYNLPPNDGWVTTINHFKNGWFLDPNTKVVGDGEAPVKGQSVKVLGPPSSWAAFFFGRDRA